MPTILLVILLFPFVALALFSLGALFWTAVSHLRWAASYRAENSTPPAMSRHDWIRFYRHTLIGALYLLWWSIRAVGQAGYRPPRGGRTSAAGSHSPRSESLLPPVLCIHGIFMNASCMWGIRQALEAAGRGTRAVSMGVPLPTPMAYAGPLIKVMDEMARMFPDQRFDVVAHSLGGVMVREVLRRRPDLAPRVGRIVTLGSPHRGTAFLRWMRFGPLYRMLSRQSTYLRDLPDFTALAPESVVTTVATQHDLVVYPIEQAFLPGANQVTLEQVSHLGLMVRPEVMEVILTALEMSPALDPTAED